MSSPTGADTCYHCDTRYVTRRVKPRIPGAVIVELRTCACDTAVCATPTCRNRATPWNATRCPACTGRR